MVTGFTEAGGLPLAWLRGASRLCLRVLSRVLGGLSRKMLHPQETTTAAVWLPPAPGCPNCSTQLFPTEVSLAVVRQHRYWKEIDISPFHCKGNLHWSCRRLKWGCEENSVFSKDFSLHLKKLITWGWTAQSNVAALRICSSQHIYPGASELLSISHTCNMLGKKPSQKCPLFLR